MFVCVCVQVDIERLGQQLARVQSLWQEASVKAAVAETQAAQLIDVKTQLQAALSRQDEDQKQLFALRAEVSIAHVCVCLCLCVCVYLPVCVCVCVGVGSAQ